MTHDASTEKRTTERKKKNKIKEAKSDGVATPRGADPPINVLRNPVPVVTPLLPDFCRIFYVVPCGGGVG